MGKSTLRYKLSLCMICADETEELDKCIASVADYVTEIVVGWNGTNPETKKILEKYGAKIIPFKWKNDFASARQLTFDNASSDIVLWLDADDTLEGAKHIPDFMKQFEDRRVGALWLYYDYERDSNGNTTMCCWRERFLNRKWFRWAGVVHEECLRKVDCIQLKIQENKCWVKHHPRKDRVERSGERNLEISAMQYDKEHKNNNVDAVNVWNYAKSLNAMGYIDKALKIFQEFVSITESNEHRYQAYTEMAKIARKMHLYDQALDYDLQAVKMKPQWPWAYFGMARTYFCEEDWKNVIFYTELGYKCKNPTDSIPIAYDPTALTVKPLEPFVYALVQVGKFQQALVATRKALQFVPDSKYFSNWDEILRKAIAKEKLETNCLELYEYIRKEGGENGKLKHFVEALPEDVKDHPVFVRLQNRYRIDKGWENRIIIYCGSSYELWDPLSIKTGIGGSEEAVINISKQLARLGWEVEVYNNCLEEGNYDGVLWQGFWRYDSNRKSAIFISWRDSRGIDIAPEGSYNILWLHDVWKQEYFTEQQLNKIDKIFVLSNWHRTCLPNIPNNKFYITRNGIIPSQFNEKIKRDPLSCIYASSPDRGLDILLENWGKIKSAVPEAMLHVYYGFTKTYDMVHKNDQRMRLFKERVMEMLKQEGVIYHGRVGHKELARAFLSCGLWLYPTYFTEISCITAMKAQAAGAIPVTTSMAALDETVQYGVKVEDETIRKITKRLGKRDKITSFVESGMKDEFTKQTIFLLKHPQEQDIIRTNMVPWARKFYNWKTVASEWDELFKKSKVYERV